MIALRNLQSDDKDMLFEWRNLPEVARYMYTDHVITRAEHDAWWARLPGDATRRYWVITHDEKPVGLAYLYAIDPAHRRAYWGFYVADPTMRGKGVGSFVEYSMLREVFETRGFDRLCCEVLVTNEPVIDMHKRFGFVQEGVLRQHVEKGGARLDVVTMGILRPEWETLRATQEANLRRKGHLP